MNKDEDLAAFLSEMQDVKPIVQDTTINHNVSAPTLAQEMKRAALEKEADINRHGLSLELDDWLDPYDMIDYRQDGIQDGVYKKLRLGKYPIESRLNITQMGLEQVRDELVTQVKWCFERGIRMLLIQHGLGLNSKPKPAKLKSYLNAWLPQLPQVIACHTALKQHGGYTATYVLLKKNPEQKQLNREKHSRRF